MSWRAIRLNLGLKIMVNFLMALGIANLLAIAAAVFYLRKSWGDDVDDLRRELAALKTQRAGSLDLTPLRLAIEKKLDDAQAAQIAAVQDLIQPAAVDQVAQPPASEPKQSAAPASKASPKQKPKPEAPAPQPTLDLGLGDVDTSHLSTDQWLGALAFPQDEDDAAGFALLRRAMDLPSSRPLLRAAQDALSMLSQLGVYMDDMAPGPIAPSAWRSFAKGSRGAQVAALGDIGTAQLAVRVATRMRTDVVFRDAVHHFLRLFDKYLIDHAAGFEDADLDRLAQTRTARAFMLLGRVSGTFNAENPAA